MSLKEIFKKLFPIFLFLLTIVWTLFILNYSPKDIIQFIGITNGYLAVFIISFLGSLSTFISLPYHLLVAIFAIGGLNPLVLGIFAGTGTMLGDSVSYLLGFSSRAIIPKRINEIFNKTYYWASSKPRWVIPLILFLYGAFVPFSNDLLVIPLGAIRYSYLKVVLPLWLGNIFFNTMIAFIGIYSIEFLGNIW